jgi:ATP-dependent DNA helicase PIF1
VGDFLQLGPVKREGQDPPPNYTFQAACWPKIFLERNVFLLRTVFRQAESKFHDFLANMRKAALQEPDYRIINNANTERTYEDGIDPICL